MSKHWIIGGKEEKILEKLFIDQKIDEKSKPQDALNLLDPSIFKKYSCAVFRKYFGITKKKFLNGK
jgi:hypothetical protein